MNFQKAIPMLILVSILGLNNGKAQSSNDQPVVTWASSPAEPGETVLLHGGNFGKDPAVELTWGIKSKRWSLSVSQSHR